MVFCWDASQEVLSLLEPHLQAFDPIALSLQASRLSMKEENSSKSYKPRHESSSDTGVVCEALSISCTVKLIN
jgi:hypothetical protein